MHSRQTSETQELPSLARTAVEPLMVLGFSADATLDEAALLARALGIQVARLAPGADLPAIEGDQIMVLALGAGAAEALQPSAVATLALRQDIGVILVCDPEDRPEAIPEERVFSYAPPPFRPRTLLRQIKSAALTALEVRRARLLESELIHRTRELRELNAIGMALSTERDLDKLLSLILRKARELAGCDAGSLYLLEEREGEPCLIFRVAQNDSVNFDKSESTPLPLKKSSLAGFVVLTGQVLNIEDAYNLPEGSELSFDRSFDQKGGYRTKSVLVVPMTNVKGERLGVLQLINRRRQRGGRRLTQQNVDDEVITFSTPTVDLVLSLAGQAAVAIENNKLYAEVRNLFEGFVSASVTAIEQRDPTTSGHSFRVATLTTSLADVVARSGEGRFRQVSFTSDQMKQIRYAALLHDFGKVGVREEVLVKGKKLYPAHLDLVRARFAYIKKWIEAETLRQKVETLLGRGASGLEKEIPEIEQRLQAELGLVDDALATVLIANEPTVLAEGNFDAIHKLGSRTYRDIGGEERPFLDEREVRLLSIRRGSLDETERRQIESHVTQTFEFLSQIPWTREFQRVPEIAYAHHEKLTGKGYPRKLIAERIPIESRMMTVADIYDALTASDRPYKKAVPVPKALAIIEAEVKEGQLDSDVVRLFIDAKVYEATASS